MNSIVNLCATILIVGLSMSTVSCLRCHVCSTVVAGQEDCMAIAEDNQKYLTNCTAPHDQTCRTQEQWVDFEMLKQTTEKRTIRQCASTPLDPDRLCYYRTGFGGRVNVCNCDEDGCNEASRTASTILMTLALLLIITLFS